MKTAIRPSAMAEDWKKKLTLDDLVLPTKRLNVPNHILDTKIFSKLNQNALIKVEPSVVHFGGYELDKVQHRSIKICNASSERQNLHIIPPATKYFSIKYTKPRRFVPGFTIDVSIKFVADEWRYYYDCIRIHSKGDENIIIPLHAYPVMDVSSFPRKLIFEPTEVALGKTIKKVIPLRSHCPVDFEFQITIVQSNPALTVQPLSGTVPGEGETSLAVSYTPTQYVTSHMTMQLNLSQFNSRPINCVVTASCSPKTRMKEPILGKSIKDLDDMFKHAKILDPSSLSPIQISRKRRTGRASVQDSFPKEIQFEGLHFPTEIHTQHAVNSVLMQKQGKLRAKDIRKTAMSKSSMAEVQESNVSSTKSSSRQMKEATFKQDVRKDAIEERANQLRWQVHLGSRPLDDESQVQILTDRERAQDEYKYRKRCEPLEEEELDRTITFKTHRRTFREATIPREESPKFDLYRNNPWLNRHRALDRFQQAARTVLIRRRADKKVKMLRQMIIGFKNGTLGAEKSVHDSFQLDVRSSNTPGSSDNVNQPIFLMTPSNIEPYTFPVYVASDSKDDIATDELGAVESPSTTIKIKTDVPFHNLKVPRQYEICGYHHSNVHDASRYYVSPTLARPLRTGAEDEIIHVTVPPHLLRDSQIETPRGKNQSRESVRESLRSSLSDESETKTLEYQDKKPSGIIMPQGLIKNPSHHPLRIFNPYPGMQRTYLPLTHSVIDPDYHLCPMPRYTTLPGARSYLDREDVIKGIMAWKKFPPQSLVSLSQINTGQDTATSWSDPFSQSMIPIITPMILRELPEEDRSNVQINTTEEETVIELTPEMIQAEFALGENLSAPETEESGQKPVVAMQKIPFDQLGAKIRNTLRKIESMDKNKPRIPLL